MVNDSTYVDLHSWAHGTAKLPYQRRDLIAPLLRLTEKSPVLTRSADGHYGLGIFADAMNYPLFVINLLSLPLGHACDGVVSEGVERPVVVAPRTAAARLLHRFGKSPMGTPISVPLRPSLHVLLQPGLLAHLPGLVVASAADDAPGHGES